VTTAPFDLVHCDVWTSPVLSTSGFKYYLVLLDDFSHYCWSFPLRHKSEVHRHIVDFIAYAQTQFATTPKSFQADNGTEFVNTATTSYLASCGILLRLSCPYTSPQNGKAERMLRTTNNTIRTMLLHAFMPPSYWAEALTLQLFSLIGVLPPPSKTRYLTNSSINASRITPPFAFSDAFAIRISLPPLPTNSPHDQHPASS
jgi:transposase InsO family protein